MIVDQFRLNEKRVCVLTTGQLSMSLQRTTFLQVFAEYRAFQSQPDNQIIALLCSGTHYVRMFVLHHSGFTLHQSTVLHEQVVSHLLYSSFVISKEAVLP